jgi:negative regulator of flagellin synthesis FlgM
MVRDISGLGSPPNSSLKTNRGNTSNAGADNKVPEKTTQSAAPNRNEQVQLSSQAQKLKAMEEKLSQLPDVNHERVAEVKARLESGAFAIDNQRLAEKMLKADDLFGN